MAQADTLSLTTGNQLSYTVVLLQMTDTYTDFLAQSGQELEETRVARSGMTSALPYPMPLCRRCAMTAAATRRSLPDRLRLRRDDLCHGRCPHAGL